MSERRIGDYLLAEPVEQGDHTVTYRASRVLGSGHLDPDKAGSTEAPGVRPSATAASSAAAPSELRERALLVKTLKPGIRATPKLRALLRREAERLEALRHPQLPTLLEAHLDAEQPMLVLRGRDGVRLDVVLAAAKRLEPVVVAAIGLELARALGALHALGQLHRRLAPAHVDLGRDGTVLLFGLASDEAPASDGEREEGDLLLAPEDMAPEQVAGDPEDARTDVYLLGALLYRMLTGHGPLARGRSSDTSGLDRPAGPSVVQPLGRRVPASLARVVMRSLSRRERDRFGDMASVAVSLVRALRAETSLPTEHLVCQALAAARLGATVAPPAEPSPGLGPMSRPTTLKLASGGAALVVLLVAAMLLVRSLGQPSAEAVSGVRGVEQRAADLRVLAQPWAEVYVDGELIDVTPIGRPIEISPGRHEVRFKHPNAAEQVRTVEVIAGQTVWLDVAMPVVRPAASALTDAAADESP
jgi:eukaryotic-like serine/threonine-protein kinase